MSLPISLVALLLDNNQIAAFNPTLPLPIGLTTLDFYGNQMTTAGYAASESWANLQPSFTSNCNISFSGNSNSVSGTNLKTILISKNATVLG